MKIQRCLIDTCRNPAPTLFPVPHLECPSFQKWQKVLKIDGTQGHRICRDHFTSEDFQSYKRFKLKPAALPSIFPTTEKTAIPKEGCWIPGCNVKAKKLLIKVPTGKTHIREKWIHLLSLDRATVRDARICHHHFRKEDWDFGKS